MSHIGLAHAASYGYSNTVSFRRLTTRNSTLASKLRSPFNIEDKIYVGFDKHV